MRKHFGAAALKHTLSASCSLEAGKPGTYVVFGSDVDPSLDELLHPCRVIALCCIVELLL